MNLDAIKQPFLTVGTYVMVHRTAVHFTIAAIAIIAAFVSINLSLYQPSDADYRAQQEANTQSSRFDSATIIKIQNLNASRQTVTDTIPAGTRTNPFSE